MKSGITRFNFYLDQLLVLIAAASKEKNPALWLYQNNARTPLFMLEALSKMYLELHNKKKFTALNEQFKLLEDALGAIDYYDSFAKEFANNKKIPATATEYLQAQAREKIQYLNKLLIDKNWLTLENNRISKIQTKLSKIDFLKDKKEIAEINKFYGKAIYEIVEFTQGIKFHFTNLEEQVHELRRKLRWLSIYPQALRGCIQLTKLKTATPKPLIKYLTKEITTSPFNIMPDAGDNKYFLLLSQDHFYALSWMIAELGKIKDDGLRLIALKEALQTTSVTEAEAYDKAYKLLGVQPTQLQTLLGNAAAISKTYFGEQNLEHLVAGVREAT